MVQVEKEVYETYYKMRRHEKYLIESDCTHGTVYYDALDTKDLPGVEIFQHPDKSPEEQMINKIAHENLLDALMRLEPDELKLIRKLFFDGKSERDYAAETGVCQSAVHKRKHRILKKLKKFIEY